MQVIDLESIRDKNTNASLIKFLVLFKSNTFSSQSILCLSFKVNGVSYHIGHEVQISESTHSSQVRFVHLWKQIYKRVQMAQYFSTFIS